MFQICITAPSDLHGPSNSHTVATGRTLGIALARARTSLSTYGPLSPGRLFYRRPGDDGRRHALIWA